MTDRSAAINSNPSLDHAGHQGQARVVTAPELGRGTAERSIQSFAAEVVTDAVRTRGARADDLAPLTKRAQDALAFIAAVVTYRGFGPSKDDIAVYLDIDECQARRAVTELIRARKVARKGPPLPHTKTPSLVVIEAADAVAHMGAA